MIHFVYIEISLQRKENFVEINERNNCSNSCLIKQTYELMFSIIIRVGRGGILNDISFINIG